MNRKDLPALNASCEVCGRKYYRCKKCIEMRNRGVEAWRAHCDSFECYQVLVLANTEDVSTIDQETFDRITALELPDGLKPVKEIQDKLDIIAEKLRPVEKPIERSQAQKQQNQGVQKYESHTKNSKHRNKVIEYIASKNVK